MKYDDFLPFAVRSQIVLHMQDTPGAEACGIIRKNGDTYLYERCENVHPNAGTDDFFRFTDAVSLAIFRKDSDIVAYVHTHPNGPTVPTKADQIMQQQIGKPGVICAKDPSTGVFEIFSHGDHLLDVDLIGRHFREAVFDCYEAMRSWVWQNEHRKLDAFPRDARWWEATDSNPDMYENGFRSQGYVEFEPNFDIATHKWHPQVGDLVMMQLDAAVINHGAVYIGDNRIYHHRNNKLSGTNALGYLRDNGFVRKWLRYSADGQ